MSDLTSEPVLSVVIPAFNAEQTIERCLISVTQARPANKEIIVVDDGSSDRTREISSNYPVKLFYKANKGAASAKNFGLLQASSQLIAFIDSDIIVEQNYFVELLNVLKESKASIAGVGGIVYPQENDIISESFKVRFFGCSPDIEAQNRSIDSLSGAASVYYKKVLVNEGGFDESIGGGEDIDLNVRIRKSGSELILVPSAKVYHLHPSKLRSLTKKWFYYGRLLVMVSRKNGLKKDWALSFGWFSACVSLFIISAFTSLFFFWLLLGLAALLPWALNYGTATINFWIHHRKLRYVAFPFIHQLIIVSRSLGVVVETLSFFKHRLNDNATKPTANAHCFGS